MPEAQTFIPEMFPQASFDNCTRLEKLNLGGLKNAKRSVDFRPNLAPVWDGSKTYAVGDRMESCGCGQPVGEGIDS